MAEFGLIIIVLLTLFPALLGWITPGGTGTA